MKHPHPTHHPLQFICQSCQTPVDFAVFELDQHSEVSCHDCGLTYDFGDPVLLRQLRKFENLCRQIHLSEEILSNTSVGIYLGDREIKIPYKILLSRLNAKLDLLIGGKPLCVTFRIEPALDLAHANQEKL